MSFSLQDPINILFNALDDLADFAELGNTPFTKRQTINKAFVTLSFAFLVHSMLFVWHIGRWHIVLCLPCMQLGAITLLLLSMPKPHFSSNDGLS